jgi:acyl-CoA thioester hydrolase
MARIKLDFPNKSCFSTTIKIRISDINYGGHMGNDALLSMLHEARLQFFNSFDASEINFLGTSVIMSDVAIQYKGEGFYGNQLLFEIAVDDIANKSFDLWYKITCDTKEIAIAKTGMVCFNYKERKTEPVPEKFVEKFNF